ncbi:hypothetical protein XF14_05375 [Burkholderia gladioli]|nr:hypothetical protein XF14_05375 [Burkholderia gladioli]
MRGEPLGLDAGLAFLCAQQLRLRHQHIHVVGQPALETLVREIEGAARERHRAGGVLALRVERADPHHVVGDILERRDQRLVVLVHGLVVAGRGGAQLRAQAPALEDRQRDGGPRRPAAVHRAQEAGEGRADAEAAQRGKQVDIRVELRLGHVDAARLRVDQPARGHHVGAPADQFGGQRGGQAGRGIERELGARQGIARAGALAGQGGELVAAELHGLLVAVDLARIVGQRRFGLAQFELGADAGAQALLRELDQLVLAVVGLLRDVEQGEILREVDIGAHHVDLQLEARRALVGGLGAGRIERALGVVLVLAPEIEMVGQVQRAAVVPAIGVGERAGAVEIVVGPVLALQGQFAVELREFVGVRDARHRLRLAHARLRGGQRRIAGLGGRDPAVELRVAIGAPPVGAGPARVAVGCADRGARVQRGGVDARCLRCNIAHARASGHC